MKKQIPNTFNLPVYAQDVIAASCAGDLLACYQQAITHHYPILILGQGSNTLFTENFGGVVILNQIEGITIDENRDYWLIKAGAGVVWHQLVSHLIDKNIPGLENLALIPGCVGSAPIQNIGAYGVEFEKFADYVELLDLTTGKIITITDGQYGYRESIFKSQYLGHYVVTAVGMKLAKQWKPILNYGELKTFNPITVTAKMIFDKVCDVRRAKLPDPAVLGNGGSFFKNPVVENRQYQQLVEHYLDMPAYLQPDGKVKLAAAWLIDQCGLKNYQIGGAAVHDKQALVLVNKGFATPQDVIDLASLVKVSVQNKFGLSLSPEIRFISQHGEMNSDVLLSQIANQT